MKNLAFALMFALASPVLAEDLPAAPPGGDTADGTGNETGNETAEGLSLMERGARMLFEGLAREIEPAMRDMAGDVQDLAVKVRPMMAELARLVDDLSAYEMPERLPNGDILIRRKPDLPPGLELGENGETEL